jgi:hypothetical protein
MAEPLTTWHWMQFAAFQIAAAAFFSASVKGFGTEGW